MRFKERIHLKNEGETIVLQEKPLHRSSRQLALRQEGVPTARWTTLETGPLHSETLKPADLKGSNMKIRIPVYIAMLVAVCTTPFTRTTSGTEVLTPCFLKLSLYEGLPGVITTDFVFEPNYPARPDQVHFIRSLDTRDALPGDGLDNYGGRIEGFLTPQESGDYTFFLRSDDGSELWLSPDGTEANAQIIAEEFDCCDPFQEPETGDTATSLPVTLTAGKSYFILVNYKEGTGGDFAQVAWRREGDPTPTAALKPIPPAFLSTMADDSQAPTIAFTQEPQNLTGEENSLTTFTVAAETTPPVTLCLQWQKNGVNIPGANGTTYSMLLSKSDHGAKIRALAAVPGRFVQSTEATLTVTDDRTAPTLLGVRGVPNHPEVIVTFSERITSASAIALSNYAIASAGGALSVSAAELSADGTEVTLTTQEQIIGTEYTLTVKDVRDRAATPNSIVAGTQAAFFGLGPWLQGADGFVVFEAEAFDRNLDGLWITDSARGEPSGGVAMLIPNGSPDSEANTKLEYDILFTKTGTHIVWYLAGSDNGNDDSAWLHLDGERPPNRVDGNTASMSGFNGDVWQWNSDPQDGPSPMTLEITTPGLHTLSLASREDGAFFDKFVITTDPNFDPNTFGPHGPPSTLRQGEPLPSGVTLDITRQPINTEALEHTTLAVSVEAVVPEDSLLSFQWQRKEGAAFVDIDGATGSALVIDRVGLEWNDAVVRVTIGTLGISKISNEATITILPETTPPSVLGATGVASGRNVILRFSEELDPTSAQNPANFKINSSAGSVSVTSASLLGNQRTVVLATGSQTVGAKYTVAINGVRDQAATPNSVTTGQARFYSLGDLQPQTSDGLLVFEAEGFARNLDDLWVVDNSRGNPSGGASVVNPNGAGGSESATQLEYDLTFTQTGTHILWYRASGESGTDDSSWFYLDGAKPANRVDGNQASMTGFSGQPDFVWRSEPQDGGGQMTFEIDTPGQHVVGLARREDGSFFDKFVITTDPDFNPEDFGPLGPAETRSGAPALPTITLSAPAPNTRFEESATVDLAVTISATTRTVSKVEYFDGLAKIGESTQSPFGFTLENAPSKGYVVTALITDDVGDSVRSAPVPFLVGQPTDVLFLVGNDDLTASPGDAAIAAALSGLGFNVVLVDDSASLESDAFGKLLIVISSTVNSGSIGTKYRNSPVPVVTWEQSNQDDFGMTGDTDGIDRGTEADQVLVDLQDSGHPLAAGLPAGRTDIVTVPTTISWGNPNENAIRIATIQGNPDRAAIYAYETGAVMADGLVAPARRVFTFLTDGAFLNVTPAGQALLVGSIQWAIGMEPGAATGPQFIGTRLDAGAVVMEWTGGGTLQSAPSVTGPWSEATGASSPHRVTPGNPQQFYRIRQ